ncbi:MAG: M23 family metallopeptidase [Calditrichaeota bacterium]|nr:M23 family metallopeptidase [Calditrichota bacterium]
MLANLAMASGYLWPLPDSRTLTGGFADSRWDHFHGGADLRARTPLKVIAPTDGWVERVNVNPGGYGRALYFRLDDGNTAVFGHLSRYEPELQELVRDSQLVSGTYRVDFSFKDSTKALHYKAGDVLCYTGSSGRGPAHLHFEIRSGAVQIDPLSFYAPKDHDDPVIVAVSYVRLSEDIPSSSGNALALSASPRIQSTEPVAFLIRTYDPGPWGRNAVPKAIRVYANEHLIFEDRSAEIDLLADQNIYEKLVFREFKDNDRDVRRLFKWPTEQVRMNGKLPAGWLENFVGVVRIEVEDRNGNTTSVRLPVESGSDRLAARTADDCASIGYELAGSETALSWSRLCSVGGECQLNNAEFAFPGKLTLTAREPFVPGKYWYRKSGAAKRSAMWRIPSEDLSAMSCYVLRGGTYGIAEDATPPKLLLSGRGGKLTFTLTDDESSIDDSSVRCKVDGEVAIPEYEYEEDGGSIWTRSKLRAGEHRVEFEAANRAGLTKSWDVKVTVR